MPDTTIKKVESASSPRGEMGQRYLVGGKRVSMRLWVLEPGSKVEAATTREYETVGYVISGRAELDIEGQMLSSKPEIHGWSLREPSTNTQSWNRSQQ
jgi:quercetin dioxygenase-like cupin family protein